MIKKATLVAWGQSLKSNSKITNEIIRYRLAGIIKYSSSLNLSSSRPIVTFVFFYYVKAGVTKDARHIPTRPEVPVVVVATVAPLPVFALYQSFSTLKAVVTLLELYIIVIILFKF